MSRFHVGAVLDRVPSPRYFEGGVSHLELVLHGTPKAATAKKMASSIPSGASLTVQLPVGFVRGARGALRHEDAAVERDLFAALRALAPRHVLLASGVELTPGARDREALEAFAGRAREAQIAPLVWQAGGLWEAEEAIALAERLGIVPAIDPLAPALPRGPVAYARVRAIGLHARLGDGTLARIAETLLALPAEDVFVAIDSGEGSRKARRLAQILSGAAIDGEDDAADDGEHEDDDE